MTKFLWEYLRNYKLRIAVAVGLCIFVGAAISFQSLVSKYIIDNVLLAEEKTLDEKYITLAKLIAGYLAANLLFRSLFFHFSLRIFENVRQKVTLAIRSKFFCHLNHLCLNFHNKNSSGDLYSYMFGTPLAEVQAFLHQIALGLPSALFAMIATIVWLSTWDWLMASIITLYIVSQFSVMWWVQKKMKVLTADFQVTEKEVVSKVGDILRASRAVKIYSMEAQVEKQFNEQAKNMSDKSYSRAIKGHQYSLLNEMTTFAFFALLLTIGSLRYIHGYLLEGEFVAYLTAFIALQGPLGILFVLAIQRANADASIERIQSMLSIETTTPDPVKGAVDCPRDGDIELKNVKFKYNETYVLHDINLKIPYGQSVALVGPSGAGKSTLSQIILRLYDVQEGTVMLGGVELKSIIGKKLRKNFGVVPQDPFIFNASIRDNLKVINADVTEQEILAACKMANAWEFIEPMKEGLDSLTGESGVCLSGGQKQRLAIARALLCEPSYFIFDEATSALDSKSERLIQSAIENSTRGKTAIIIAHRLATIKRCDRIIVMNEGRIVQDGTFRELSAKEGLFKELLEGQVLIGA